MSVYLQMIEQHAGQWILGVSIFVVVLLIVLMVQTVKLNRINRMIRQILPESGDDFLSIMDQQRIWNEEADKKMTDLHMQDQRLLERINKAYQYFGRETYSAFDNGGRELSFSLAMLDAHLNGWILSSLYAGAEGSSVYFKEIQKGKPIERLTPEEERALKGAIAEKS